MKAEKRIEQNRFTYKPLRQVSKTIKIKRQLDTALTESELICCLCATD